MILDAHVYNKLTPYRDTLTFAATHSGRGSLSYYDANFLIGIYESICEDRVCASCDRTWLWRLGVWFKETEDTHLPTIEDAPKKKRSRTT